MGFGLPHASHALPFASPHSLPIAGNSRHIARLRVL